MDRRTSRSGSATRLQVSTTAVSDDWRSRLVRDREYHRKHLGGVRINTSTSWSATFITDNCTAFASKWFDAVIRFKPTHFAPPAVTADFLPVVTIERTKVSRFIGRVRGRHGSVPSPITGRAPASIAVKKRPRGSTAEDGSLSSGTGGGGGEGGGLHRRQG